VHDADVEALYEQNDCDEREPRQNAREIMRGQRYRRNLLFETLTPPP
jgi:hypothetical protein